MIECEKFQTRFWVWLGSGYGFRSMPLIAFLGTSQSGDACDQIERQDAHAVQSDQAKHGAPRLPSPAMAERSIYVSCATRKRPRCRLRSRRGSTPRKASRRQRPPADIAEVGGRVHRYRTREAGRRRSRSRSTTRRGRRMVRRGGSEEPRRPKDWGRPAAAYRSNSEGQGGGRERATRPMKRTEKRCDRDA